MIAWLEREYGEDWFLTGRAADTLRELFRQGTRPTNEDVSRQVGAGAENFDALERHLS